MIRRKDPKIRKPKKEFTQKVILSKIKRKEVLTEIDVKNQFIKGLQTL